MVDYELFLSGGYTPETPRNHYDDLNKALTLSLDPVLIGLFAINILTFYKVDKNDKNRFWWVVGSNAMNIYLINLVIIRRN